jgi:hypothetical protein
MRNCDPRREERLERRSQKQRKMKSAQQTSIGNGGLATTAKASSTTVSQSLLLTRCVAPGRHALAVTPEGAQNAKYLTPSATSTLKETLKGVWRMFSTYPYWDVSYLVAIIFTVGSVIWCINAFFVWLPLQDPSTEFEGEIANGGGITAFIGATVFEFGSILLMIEAVNENRADCFGWAVEEVLEERGMIRLKPAGCVHHHKNKHNLVGKGKASDGKHYISSQRHIFILAIHSLVFDLNGETMAQNCGVQLCLWKPLFYSRSQWGIYKISSRLELRHR